MGFLLLIGGSICSALTSNANAQSNFTINVAKTTEGDFTVTNGASYIGSYFDTTYTMTGAAADFILARDALTSSITEDFNNSPTIGYIRMNNTDTQPNTNVTGLANPFVTTEQIDDKIRTVLAYAIDKIENPVGITLNADESRQIKCQFSNVLNDFWCDIPTFVVR